MGAIVPATSRIARRAVSSALRSIYEGGAPLTPNISLLTPNVDGTLSLTDQGTESVSVTTTRATTAMARDWTGTYYSVASGEARIEGTRYDAGTHYWKDGSGNPLRPTVTSTIAGYRLTRFVTYKPHTPSETVTAGARRYVEIGGLGYYATCTVGGTCAGTAPTWVADGTDITDNTVTWTVGATDYYRIKGVLIEEAATNSLLQSRAFTTSPWTVSGTPTSAQDQVGIDGVANTAWTLGDDAATLEYFLQQKAIPNDSNTHVAHIFVKKDTDESRFPRFSLFLSGGTAVNSTWHLNTKTGAFVDTGGSGTRTGGVIDRGNWWQAYFTATNNGTGNAVAQFFLIPADGTVFGTTDVATTGTIVADQAQLELNRSYPSSPIPTTTAAVPRNADVDSLTEFLSDTAGTLLVDVQAANYLANARIVGGDTNGVLESKTTNGTVQVKDGTNTVEGPAVTGAAHRIGVRYSGSALQVVTDGTAGTEGSYDGGWNNATNYLGSNNGANAFNGHLLNLMKLGDKDIGEANTETATTREAV